MAPGRSQIRRSKKPLAPEPCVVCLLPVYVDHYRQHPSNCCLRDKNDLGKAMCYRRGFARLTADLATARATEAEAACAAMRAILELALRCARCCGSGRYDPPCRLCEDSTEDHECPGEVSCEYCGGTGQLGDGSGARTTGIALYGRDVCAVLATDAGKRLLDEMARLRARDAALDDEQPICQNCGEDPT